MVMLVPFTTALPAQNGYSDYAPKNQDAGYECRTDETERLAAEKQEETTRKPDDEPDEEDFSKVLGMLLAAVVAPEKPQPAKVPVTENAATVEATTSDLQNAAASGTPQGLPAAGQNSAASTQNDLKSPLPEQLSSAAPPKSIGSDVALTPTPSTTSEKPGSAEIQAPDTAIALGKADVKSQQTSEEVIIPGNNSQEKSTPFYPAQTTAELQTKVEVLPNAEVGFRQFGIESTFLSATRPYESTKDTDAVTQEIMNALSRAVAATAPMKSRPGADELPSNFSGTGLSEITNITRPTANNIGPLNSLKTSLNTSDELLQEAGGRQISVLAGARGESSDQFWMQQPGSDTDRGPSHSASRESDQMVGNVTQSSSPGSDGARLTSSGAITLALPDLATSVASEMRQPLSSQVSRAVMEHLERKTTAESETLTVRLDPPDLGEMVIELSKSKEGLSVRVTAREAVTMDMLLARGSEIETQLRGEKMDLRSLEFLSPDMMNGGAFQQQSSQDSTSQFDQPVGNFRRSTRGSTSAQVSAAGTTRAGDSQHALNFRA